MMRAPLLVLLSFLILHLRFLPSAEAATSQVFMNQVCGAGKVNVTLTWQGNDTSAQQQWIDLSTSDNGWAAGSFISAGPLAGPATQYVWNGLTPSTLHYVRVNQQLADGSWDASSAFSFTTIDCGAAVSSGPPAPNSAQALITGSVYTDQKTGQQVAVSGSSAFAQPPNITTATVLGFSANPASTVADLTLPGGTLHACTPAALYVYVAAPSGSSASALLELAFQKGSWTYNGTALDRPPSPIVIIGTVVRFAMATAGGNSAAAGTGDYAVSLSGGLQGSVKVGC